MGKIFISYRRDDSADITGRVYERLIKQFGRENVFRDVDDISLGADFRVEVSKALAQCVVMIVIIGKQWLTILSENGARRLDSPSDYVRVEVEAGLARHIPVIPLFVHGARPPHESDLPESIQRLSFRNGMDVHGDPHFQSDVELLMGRLKPLLASPGETISVDDTERRELVAQADDLKRQGKFAKALPLYERATKLPGASASDWGNLGYVCNKLRRWQDGLRAHDQALALNANLAWVWTNRGDALRALGRYDEAASSYQKGLAISPTANRYRDLAVVFRLAGRLSDAEQADQHAKDLGG